MNDPNLGCFVISFSLGTFKMDESGITLFTCFTVDASISRFTFTAITSNKIHTLGSVLTWAGRAFIDI